MTWSMYPLGDSAVLIEFGHTIHEEILTQVTAAVAQIEQYPFAGVIECIPSFTTVSVFYDLNTISFNDVELWVNQQHILTEQPIFDYVCFQIEQALTQVDVQSQHASYSQLSSAPNTSNSDSISHLSNHPDLCAPSLLNEGQNKPLLNAKMSKTIIEIPVCYGGEFGPDLEYVAAHHHLSTDEVIRIHCSSEYLIYAIGFAPGFPYMGGMSEQIATPRKSTPRLVIPAGSVGIAGKQTGIYPLATPGGWQLIGRTPLALFQPHQYPPVLLQSGSYIRFRAIDHAEYDHLVKQSSSISSLAEKENL